MSGDATSLRGLRLRALAPRALLYALVGILCLAGVRSILEPEPKAAAKPRVIRADGDPGALAFAESFARAYLRWDADRMDEREKLLGAYLPRSLAANAGFRPGDETAQDVLWTTVLGSARTGGRALVTVAAETTGGRVYLSVPVARDGRGFLYVAAYPAFVGPPASADAPPPAVDEEVPDRDLAAVIHRAIRNYLLAARGNLAADLSPGAVVSLPARPLRVTRARTPVWLERGRRAAIEVDAQDGRKSTWTLRYELAVEKRDRWYVRSLQVDPTFQGGS